jgi:exodeoxyribonuclease VII small subunit
MAKAPAKKAHAAPGDEPAELAPLPDSYEDALAELEGLVSRMEAGALPLEQLLGSYRRGGQLLAFCKERLDVLDAQVKLFEGGQLKPWDAA